MKPNLVLFTSRQNDPTDCILVRKYQKIQSTDQSTILTNYNIYLLNLKLKVENKKNFTTKTEDHCSIFSPINREFYLAKGTEKFILGRYLLSGTLLMLLSLRPWGVAARPAILENRGGKSHFCDYFIIRARYLCPSYYRKCRACNSLHFLFFMFF
jgi:hypothetical protein